MKYYHAFSSKFDITKSAWVAHYCAFHLAISDKPHLKPSDVVASSPLFRLNGTDGAAWIASQLLRRRVVVPAYHCGVGPAVVLAALLGWKGKGALEWVHSLPPEEKEALLRYAPLIHINLMRAIKGGCQCTRSRVKSLSASRRTKKSG